MLKKILYNLESIIIQDTLSYLVGPVKLPASIIVTNHRILIMPHNDWGQSLGFHPRSINWSELKEINIAFLGKNLNLKDHNESYSLWGGSAKILHKLLQYLWDSNLSLETPEEKIQAEKISFSSEVEVMGLAGLTVMGHLFIRKEGIALKYQMLDSHDIHFAWNSLTSIEYKSISQTLKMSLDSIKITLRGNQAQLLYHLFEIFRQGDIFIDGIWPGKWVSNHGGGSGYIFLGNNSIYFIPCGLQSSLSNATIESIPCSDIQYFTLQQKTIILITSVSKRWDITVDVPDIWLDYHQRLLLQFWSRNNKHHPERYYCSHLSSEKNAFTIGFLTCNQEEIVFSPNGALDKIYTPSYEVIKLNQRSSRLNLQHQITPSTFEFEDKQMAQNVHDTIEPLISPMSVSISDENQPMETILGNIKRLSIFLDGSKQVTLNKVYIQDQQKLIKIKTAQYPSVVFLPPQIEVDIDIISEKGQFGLRASVVHNHLNNPDSKGFFGLILRPIRSLKTINQRTAFRVPVEETIHFSTNHPELKLENEVATMTNLSSGGCQFEFKPSDKNPIDALEAEEPISLSIGIEKVKEIRKPNRRFVKKIVTTEFIELDGIIRQIRNKEGSKEIIFGIQFVNIDFKAEHKLLRKIVLSERKLNRERKKHQD